VSPRLASILALLLVACGGGFGTYVPRAPEPTCGLVARLDRGGCLGWCPVYRVVLCADGTVVYDGVQWVKVTGRHVGHMSPDALRAVALELDRAPDGPSPLEEPVIYDAPTTHLLHMRGGVMRWPSHEGGLVRRFESAVGSAAWVGTEEERQRLYDESR
jgi:hypothetical protein